jgi:hypothetical protein
MVRELTKQSVANQRAITQARLSHDAIAVRPPLD